VSQGIFHGSSPVPAGNPSQRLLPEDDNIPAIKQHPRGQKSRNLRHEEKLSAAYCAVYYELNMKKMMFAAAVIVAAATLETTVSPVYAQGVRPIPSYAQLGGTHDIALSPWGPYSKKYAGISHIPDMRSGFRFDVSVAPGIVGSKPVVPDVLKPSGYIPWDIDRRMTQFTYRYELLWKDQVFVEVTYTVVDAKTVQVEMRCVNHTTQSQNLALNVFANLVYPTVYPRTQIRTSGSAFWVNAAQYTSLELGKKSATYNLQPDGALRGEVRGREYIDGRGVGRGFGANVGDVVTYDLPIRDKTARQGVLQLRYRLKEGTRCTLHATGLVTADIPLTGNGGFQTASVPYTRTDSKGPYRLSLTSDGGAAFDLNGLMVVPQGEAEPEISDAPPVNNQPTTMGSNATRTLWLKYEAVPNAVYGLAWDKPAATVSNLKGDAGEGFDSILDKTQGEGKGAGDTNYTNLSIRPLALSPNSEQTVRAVVVAAGSDAEAVARLAQTEGIQKQADAVKRAAGDPFAGILPQGQKYTQSQRLMRATVLSDIVYPVYTQGNNIRHFTPGKKWDSLYTWDAGFIALGLAEINRDLAIQCVNTYTTPVGSQSAFIHHGSPVPTQMFAFLELWQRTQSPEFLRYFYPRLVQYYRFLSGSAPTSTTRNLKSSLIRTWDYFYNSGGWDDYPPQVAAHKQRLEQSITPVVSTAQCIRVAKILRLAAKQLGRKEDIAGYDKDIAVFSESLQKNSWDEKAGYYSYVLHDKETNPVGHFPYTSAGTDPVNYNMGLDGVYPLFAGICTPKQQEVLLDKIFSEKHLWTPAGIGAVDQSAPYYRPDGYWNGTVWMPHQWFLWKSMLDLGRADLAFRIAERGLNVYSAATDDTYQTWENFRSATGEGSGWPQFSGLSTPVLSWFSAYYRPGTITTGYEVWIQKQSFGLNNSRYEARVAFDEATASHARDLVACLNPAYTYKATFNGKEIKITVLYPGLLNVHLPATNEAGTLLIRARG
jgi:hypothetical protein